MDALALKRGKALTFGGFLLLCVLWAADSLRGDLLPPSSASVLPPLERQALQFALLAIAAAVVAAFCGAEWPRGREAGRCVLAGVALFLAPALLIHFSRDWISDLSRVALLSLVPVFALAFEPYIGSGSESPSKGGLIASLAGVGGTLLIFPIYIPASIPASGAFCALIGAAACIAAANCWAVSIATEWRGRSMLPMVALMSGSAAAGFGLASVLTEDPTLAWSPFRSQLGLWAALEWPALLLLFWLMSRMSAVQMTTRFLLAPLIANIVSLLILLRLPINLRTGLGLLLIAAGAGWLLIKPAGDDGGSSVPPLFVSNE